MNVLIETESGLALSWGCCCFTPGPGQEVIETEQCLCCTKIWHWNSETQLFENSGDFDTTLKSIVLQDLITQTHYQIVVENGVLKIELED